MFDGMVISCIDVVLEYVTEAYISWTFGESVCVINEKIFEIGNDGLRKMVVFDGSMKKYTEVFWYLGTDMI